MKRKNKLPRYWLGTRMPTSLGYQQPNHNGGETVTSTPGLDFNPQVRSILLNIIPSSLSKLSNTSSYALNALKNTIKLAPSAAATTAINNSMANFGSTLPSAAKLISGISTTVNNINKIGAELAALAVGKTGLSTLGTVTAGIGTAYGLYDMGNLILHNQDYMTAGLMRNMLTRNEYTTEGGNRYVKYSGLDRGAIERHAKAERLRRNANFTATSIGTGMSAGALIGGAIGSIGPGLGTAIGAGVGALGGGIAYLAGLGNILKEEEKLADNLNDAISMEGRQSESVARNNDVKQGFYSRTKSGTAGAALGKFPVWTPEGATRKKVTAKVSKGELIGNFEDGTVFRVPGIPNNNDTENANLKPNDWVLSNKFGLSNYAAQTGDYMGALKAQDIIMNSVGNRYKYGKMPKYGDGTPWADAALIAGPHIGAILANLELYNRLKNASTYTPYESLNSAYGNAIAAQMEGDLIDARPYLNQAWKSYRLANWDANRQVGLGLGGRSVVKANLFRNMLDYRGDVLNKIQEANRAQRNQAREIKFKNYLNDATLRHDSWWKRENEMLAKQGSLNNLMALIPLNLYNINSSLSKGLLANSQHIDAMDIARELNSIYRSKVNNDNYIAQLQSKWLGNNTATAAPTTTSTNINIPQILLNNPDFLRMIYQLNYSGR